MLNQLSQPFLVLMELLLVYLVVNLVNQQSHFQVDFLELNKLRMKKKVKLKNLQQSLLIYSQLLLKSHLLYSVSLLQYLNNHHYLSLLLKKVLRDHFSLSQLRKLMNPQMLLLPLHQQRKTPSYRKLQECKIILS